MLTYQFQATQITGFAWFEAGDRVTGVFSYDTADTTGAGGNTLSLQDFPTLVITYTDASTGQTATATLDPADNAGHDLRVYGDVSGMQFIFTNLITSANSLFGSGLEFGLVDLRFFGASPSLATDLSSLTPTFVTMELVVYDVLYGPNFEFTRLQPVPEPASLAVLATGLLGFGWARRRRASASPVPPAVPPTPPPASR